MNINLKFHFLMEYNPGNPERSSSFNHQFVELIEKDAWRSSLLLVLLGSRLCKFCHLISKVQNRTECSQSAVRLPSREVSEKWVLIIFSFDSVSRTCKVIRTEGNFARIKFLLIFHSRRHSEVEFVLENHRKVLHVVFQSRFGFILVWDIYIIIW